LTKFSKYFTKALKSWVEVKYKTITDSTLQSLVANLIAYLTGEKDNGASLIPFKAIQNI